MSRRQGIGSLTADRLPATLPRTVSWSKQPRSEELSRPNALMWFAAEEPEKTFLQRIDSGRGLGSSLATRKPRGNSLITRPSIANERRAIQMNQTNESSAEQTRLHDDREGRAAWKKWGPYLSERQWGTVREDYSSNGDAWNYFTHDHARYRAYRWGEDGLAGISDNRQLLCFALALWNGRDPILKERLFGLTNSEGNHGEDVKEYYFYLDSTPTHSYMRYLYKYPQAEYPYVPIIVTNRGRSREDFEYELLDTGVFDGNRYWDVFVEYGKASPEDILVQITVCNRGPEAAALHVLPTLWFRNTWSWGGDAPRPSLRQAAADVV